LFKAQYILDYLFLTLDTMSFDHTTNMAGRCEQPSSLTFFSLIVSVYTNIKNREQGVQQWLVCGKEEGCVSWEGYCCCLFALGQVRGPAVGRTSGGRVCGSKSQRLWEQRG